MTIFRLNFLLKVAHILVCQNPSFISTIDTHICVNPSGKLVSDQGSQTIYLKYELSAKVESMVLRKDVFTTARYHYSNTDHGYHIRLGP